MSVADFWERVKKFFRENVGEVIGVYFDGEKIFIARLTEKFETVEIDADGVEPEQLAEKILLVCKQRAWKTSAIGLCLRGEDGVIFQTEVSNIPEKDFPALVKSWAIAQAGTDAVSSFVKVGEELWMETLPRTKVEEFCAAFKKFGLKLCALSIMPADLMTKVAPLDRTKFISEIVREKKSPNLLRNDVWSWERIYQAAAAIFIIGLLIGSTKLFFDYRTASAELDAAKISIDELREDVDLKKSLDDTVAELHKLNKIAAQVSVTNNLNLLINLGKIADKNIHLTKIRVEKNFLELEGTADNPDAVKNYLVRVKISIIESARLEHSSERDDGDIAFVIHATF